MDHLYATLHKVTGAVLNYQINFIKLSCLYLPLYSYCHQLPNQVMHAYNLRMFCSISNMDWTAKEKKDTKLMGKYS